jgi:hypothetical protein
MRSIAVIAVHGTFATDAPWTKPDSDFAALLRQALPADHIEWHSFNWSGANNHKARELAANDLQRQLAALARSGENNIHIISHSHGGNVALMALCAQQSPSAAVRTVTCLSTPFFIAEPNDIEHFVESAHGSLTLKPLLLMSLLYFACLEFLSNLIPGITAVGMVLYAVLLLIAATTSAAANAMRGKLGQKQLLQRYDYSKITQPILSLHASLDEAFHLLNANALVAGVPTVIYWIVLSLFFLAIPFVLIIGWAFLIPLLILAPLIYVAGQGIRFLVRAAPWAMGEGFLHSILVNFGTRNVLNLPNAKNMQIPVAQSETHKRLKLRHSALYASPAAAKEIATFIRANSA